MRIERKLELIEEKIKRTIQENTATFEISNHEILQDIEKKDMKELTDTIYNQKENIKRYTETMKSLRLQLKIVDSLKKYVKGIENE